MTDASSPPRATGKKPPRILCIGMPVRDLTFRVHGLPARGSKENATHFDEICGGNALNGAIGIVRLGGRASICGPMGDEKETTSKYIYEKMAEEGIETTINPPLVLVGRGARLSTVEIQRLVVPLTTAYGEVKLHVALREAA